LRSNDWNIRHLDVHECDVRPSVAELLDGFAAGRSFADHQQIRLLRDEHRHPFTQNRMIVNHQDADPVRIHCH